MALRRGIHCLRLVPAAAWIFIQIAMSSAFAVSLPGAAVAGAPSPGSQASSDLAEIKRALPAIEIVLCAPLAAHGDAPAKTIFHGCDWCQSFSSTVLPKPACLPAPQTTGPAPYVFTRPDGILASDPELGFSSRAPPSADLTNQPV